MEGAKVVWEKEKQALLESIRLSQENQTTLQQEMEVVTERLRENSVSLSLSLQENVSVASNVILDIHMFDILVHVQNTKIIDCMLFMFRIHRL